MLYNSTSQFSLVEIYKYYRNDFLGRTHADGLGLGCRGYYTAQESTVEHFCSEFFCFSKVLHFL